MKTVAYLVSNGGKNVFSENLSLGAIGLITPGPLGGSYRKALTQFQSSLKIHGHSRHICRH